MRSQIDGHKEVKFNLLKEHFLPAFLVVSALLELLGWFAGNLSLIRIVDSWPAISILSAINFMLLGLAVEVSSYKNRQASRKTDSKLSLLLYILLIWIFGSSFLALLRSVFSWLYNIESWFWPDLQIKLLGEIVLMSPSSTICFILSAGVIFLNNRKRGTGNLMLLYNIGALLLTFAVLISRAYQSSEIYAISIFKQTSVISATTFLLFHLVWITQYSLDLSAHKVGKQGKALYLSFSVLLISFAVLGVTSSRSVINLIKSHESQILVQEEIKDFQNILINLLNMETGGRGYVITGEKSYLEPFELGLKDYTTNRENLKRIGSFNRSQNAKLEEIDSLAQNKIENIKQLITKRKQKSYRETAEFVKTDSGKQIMDRIRFLVDQLTQEQVLVLKSQAAENKSHASSSLISLVSGSLLAAIILILCFVFYQRNDVLRFQAENEIKNLNKTLSEKLKETEILNKELESFSYSVSHDLRAPLRAMSGFGEILLDDLSQKINQSEADYLQRIISASKKMSRLIDGLLSLSRLTRTQVNKTDVKVLKIVSELATDFEISEGPRRFNLKFNASTTVWGDETLVTLLLQNLIGNAWKFTSKKTDPVIEVGSFERNQKTLFYVKDNGAGFDMKYSNKLFGTFQRLHFESEFEGTGIGLATSKRIVSIHGGEIWAEAKEGEGATFFFYLPDKGESA